MLPVFRNVPVNVTTPPSGVGATGQVSVTARFGAPTTGQVAGAVALIRAPVQRLLALADSVAVIEHPEFAGTV
jgi:hypothetical protein